MVAALKRGISSDNYDERFHFRAPNSGQVQLDECIRDPFFFLIPILTLNGDWQDSALSLNELIPLLNDCMIVLYQIKYQA